MTPVARSPTPVGLAVQWRRRAPIIQLDQIRGRWMKRPKGFTLIELMIAVAVVAILAAIALPSYEDQMRKSRRANAQAFMADVAQREQQRFLDTRSYVPAANNAAFPAALSISVPSDVSGFYNLSVTVSAGPPPGFTITATPTGKQVPDGTLVMDHLGNKSRAGDPSKW
ncbi:MAG TPA: type IV pilin protein [Nevskiales bacterium]|nr:type IV pilin protein [Nevskiales bacterium]